MTPEQINLIRQSFQKVAAQADVAADVFYNRLFETKPILRLMFPADLSGQKQKLMKTLGLAVASLDTFEELKPALENLGRKHALYGVRDEYYPTVGGALLWTLNEILGAEDFNTETEMAWAEMFETVSGVMICAAHKLAAATVTENQFLENKGEKTMTSNNQIAQNTVSTAQNLFQTFLLALVCFLFASAANAQTTSFTYQGKLSENSAPAGGNYDMQFSLCSLPSGGICKSSPAIPGVQVTDGVFTVTLDFGNSFNGGDQYLQINVFSTATNAYVGLSPRQKMTSAPYAIRALSAATADTAATATTANDALSLGGTAANQYAQTNDSRLSDARAPTAGSAFYIHNGNSQQIGNFNLLGTGAATIINAGNQFQIGGNRVLSIAGTDNIFVGGGAGAANTPGVPAPFSGTQNTFVGSSAGTANTSGNGNSFVGYKAGFKNTIGSANAFFGAFAGNGNTAGNHNSFFGVGSGQANTSGEGNSFFGRSAGFANSVGDNNSFFGLSAGYSNVSGRNNAFFGFDAGSKNTAGKFNSFFGSEAGLENTTGEFNTFFGINAGRGNTIGELNTFIGSNAGINNATGLENTFVGSAAGNSNTIGDRNTFLGDSAGKVSTTGSHNTFVGNESGHTNAAGNYNTLLGDNANVAVGNLSYATAIGANAKVYASNTIVLGTSAETTQVLGKFSVSTLGAAGSTQLCRNVSEQISTCSSSLRYKTNIAPFNFGLNLVKNLRPITFDWKDGGMADLGLGAEEVAAVEPLLVTYNKAGEVEGVKYDRVGVVLLNAVKEQQTQIEQQQQQIKQQQILIDGLKKLVCQTNARAGVCQEEK